MFYVGYFIRLLNPHLKWFDNDSQTRPDVSTIFKSISHPNTNPINNWNNWCIKSDLGSSVISSLPLSCSLAGAEGSMPALSVGGFSETEHP